MYRSSNCGKWLVLLVLLLASRVARAQRTDSFVPLWLAEVAIRTHGRLPLGRDLPHQSLLGAADTGSLAGASAGRLRFDEPLQIFPSDRTLSKVTVGINTPKGVVYTMNNAGSVFEMMNMGAELKYTAQPFANSGPIMSSWPGQIRATANITLNGGPFYRAGPVYIADAAALTLSDFAYASFSDGPVLEVANSGSYDRRSTWTSFRSDMRISSGARLDQRRGYVFDDATGAGAGPTTQIAFDVGSLTRGTSNISYRSSGTDVQMRHAGCVRIGDTDGCTDKLEVNGNAAIVSAGGLLRLSGATNGTTSVQASPTARGTLTLPPATDTLVARATTDALTNKTIDAEGTGNTLRVPERVWLPAGSCNNGVASSRWDLPTSSAASPSCVAGTNVQKAVLDYGDASGGFSAQTTLALPADWTTSGGIDVKLFWTTSATSGNVRWSISTACTATAGTATDDPSFNEADTVTTEAPSVANRVQTSAIAGLNTTACTTATSTLVHLKVFRDGGDPADTIGATARLIGVELTYRRAM